MSLVHEIDYGTPASKSADHGQAHHRRQRSHRCRPAPRSCGRRWTPASRCPSSAPPTPSTPSAPADSASWRSPAEPAPRLVHDAGRRRHGRVDPDRAAEEDPQGRDGALHLRPSARLPDLRCQRRLRVAGHGGRRRPARRALWLRGREPRHDARENPLEKDESNPYFTFDPSKCIVCSRCVRACEEVQGTFALTIQGRGFDSKVSAGAFGRQFPEFRVRVLRRLRAGLPDRHAVGEER